MRITSFLLLAACLQVSARTYAQRITLKEKDVPLAKIFTSIEAQTGYNFAYTGTQLSQSRPVSIDITDATLDQVLAICFLDQPFTYTIIENTIVVKPKPAAALQSVDSLPPPPPNDIHGRITDSLGNPLAGASVTVKGTKFGAQTDANGEFVLKNVTSNAILIFSHVGFEKQEIKINGKKSLYIKLKSSSLTMSNVVVTYSNGYQDIPKERATGSFMQVDNELYNRSVTPDVLTKINGLASGVYFSGSGNYLNSNYGLPNVASDPNNKLGIVIRGQSTLSNEVSKDPLIVVDNFPYEGDINNLNPEMVESITVLKDASAASIWGARAGNGVIVITTKKAKYNQTLNIDVNSNVTIGNKPNVFYLKQFLNSSDFINVEDTLFNYGYFNGYTQNSNFPAVSQVVQLLTEEQNDQISAATANQQINTLRNYDVRNDYEKYIYQKSVNQQYGVTIGGGTSNLSSSFSAGFDNVNSNLIRSGYNRVALNSYTTYRPLKNLEISGRISYLQLNMQSDNAFAWGTGGLSTGGAYQNNLLPYAQLTNANGQHLPITYNYSDYYVDSVYQLGFLNWQYNPLDELANADNTSKQTDIILNAQLKYFFTPFLNISMQYQDEDQNTNTRGYANPNSYAARNLVNEFTQYIPGQPLSYPFPEGGILNLGASGLVSTNYRGQLNYNQKIGANNFSGIVGAEIRQTTSSSYAYTSYGYNDSYGSAVTNIDYYDGFVTNPNGYSQIPSPAGGITTTTNRFISYYSNLGYTLKDKYTVTLSGRRDGANIFGVNTNDKITPFWSTGAAWAISRESFYTSGVIPYLNLRSSYGFNGNVYNGISYLTAVYEQNSLTGLQQAVVTSPPNPDLSWEKVKNVNIGLDFAVKRNVLSGTVEWYLKSGKGLIEPEPLAPQTGFGSFNGNAAETLTKGWDITLNSKNINREFKWNTTFIFSTLHDEVKKYSVPQTASSIQNSSVALLGKPLFGVYGYKWAGLDPSDGDPHGYLGGKVSKDYSNIINNYSPDSLKFDGSAVPTVFGSIRNSFYYRGFSFSFNWIYKLGYVFRKPSTSINYSDIISSPVSDYSMRWQKPGDERITSVPSVVYPSNPYRNEFYQYSQVLIVSGDFLRWQDIRFGYDFGKFKSINKYFGHLEVFSYINNVGIVWRKNKDGIDPDFITGLPMPTSYSFGVKANF